MKLDPFYLIVDSADWIEKLIPLGVKLVQLRMKNVPLEVLHQHIQRAKLVCKQFHCQLIINDYWKAAIEEKCDFIHLGQEDLIDANVDKIKKAGLKLGVSTHDASELNKALAVKPDYVALGPVYQTILKKMKWQPQGLEKVTRWKKLVGDLPLVAIGGLNPERAKAVLEAGADSAAVVTDIAMNENPEDRVKQWLEATQKWR
ncbi:MULTISPECIES: thiamine phosphate synthase [Bartonella]|uniref:thiamine phosphate synthase n=1 Tax=Bartonella TaxID=773 RepID=UPI0018DEC0AE|nr:thiamine phosphate synthase [Bartonella sp. P0291]MBH9996885.1 thiamine phosphate synthase [Bartonella sp. M0192]MBH9999045.1 thiamine phosphate synthase [Bartonella sp. M0191]MBI0007425.1 thiamine phosphate synthase [Bartonella sp. M0193]MBI0010336.1 thiamine phosphate synthase [Bartonella sp. M0176]MBI0012543.1 thiamine phosphate synthase [Bartonella apihabitans]